MKTLLCVFSSTVIACGGATDYNLFGAPNTQDATVTPDVTTTFDGGVQPDTSIQPVVDSSVPDTSPPSGNLIACGATACDPKTSACCRSGSGPDAGDYTFTCTTDPDNDCSGIEDVVIKCSNAANCAGNGGNATDLCCADTIMEGPVNVAVDTLCASKNECSVIVCDPNAKAPCPNGFTCGLSSATLIGYYICK